MLFSYLHIKMAESPIRLAAKRLYRLAWRHYMFQVGCIERDDYARLQELVGYPESYEEHMGALTCGIPHDSRVMVDHIERFLSEYVEFQDEKYSDKIEEMIERLHRNKEQHKRNALERLMKENEENGADDRQSLASSSQRHPPLFEIELAAGKLITLPTYGNPMMTALYSLLFVCFVLFSAEIEIE